MLWFIAHIFLKHTKNKSNHNAEKFTGIGNYGFWWYNVYASNKLDKYENRTYNLEQLCVADFTSVYDYVGKFEEE